MFTIYIKQWYILKLYETNTKLQVIYHIWIKVVGISYIIYTCLSILGNTNVSDESLDKDNILSEV